MENIVVAVDGGPSGDAALDWVIERARSRGDLRLSVVVVQEPVGTDDTGHGVGAVIDFRSMYQSLLDAAVARVHREAPAVPVRAQLRSGNPRVELTRAAVDADLLVVGSSRRGRVAGALGGTLALRLAATSRCCTVVVPTDWNARRGEIMVALDVTKEEPEIANFADREAQGSDHSFTVIHAWNVPTLVAVALLAQPTIWQQVEDERRTAMIRSVETIRRDHPDTRVREMLREGPAGRVLVDEASAARMLVIGRHRAEVGEDVLLGATAHNLLLDLPCPIAVIPA